jgi:ABC-type lipoprotein export system ATPase subunit
VSNLILQAEDVWLEYDGIRPVTAVRGVNLTLGAGEFVALAGPSGSGKSSLLFLLAGLRRASRGRVLYRGAEWPPGSAESAELRRRNLGLVFSAPFLVPYLTVRENALVQLDPDSDEGWLGDLAARLDIRDLLDELPARLSSGEAQRVSILRALVNRPALILADEPTAHLDHDTGLRVIRTLRDSAPGCSVVLASHDPEVFSLADRICRLRDGAVAGAAGT